MVRWIYATDDQLFPFPDQVGGYGEVFGVYGMHVVVGM